MNEWVSEWLARLLLIWDSVFKDYVCDLLSNFLRLLIMSVAHLDKRAEGENWENKAIAASPYLIWVWFKSRWPVGRCSATSWLHFFSLMNSVRNRTQVFEERGHGPVRLKKYEVLETRTLWKINGDYSTSLKHESSLWRHKVEEPQRPKTRVSVQHTVIPVSPSLTSESSQGSCLLCSIFPDGWFKKNTQEMKENGKIEPNSPKYVQRKLTH